MLPRFQQLVLLSVSMFQQVDEWSRAVLFKLSYLKLLAWPLKPRGELNSWRDLWNPQESYMQKKKDRKMELVDVMVSLFKWKNNMKFLYWSSVCLVTNSRQCVSTMNLYYWSQPHLSTLGRLCWWQGTEAAKSHFHSRNSVVLLFFSIWFEHLH